MLLFDGITLPLEDPILKFLLILVIILAAPLLLNKLKIPYLLGLIIAGAVIGPHGLNLVLRDSSIILSGTAGLLYIMFLSGLDMDMSDFRKNGTRSLVFGLYTFCVPLLLGILAGYYILGFSIYSSILLAGLFASQTLIAYPIVSKLGIARDKAVTIAVGGTVITDTLALLLLTVIVGMVTGNTDDMFWYRLGISVVLCIAFIMQLFPLIGHWFFKHCSDNISQYIFVLVMVFLGAYLAHLAGLEPIIGAFLAGLALNRLIPRTSPLMNRIEFVGNAIFIPFFLIGVGMLIDYRAFFRDWESIKVAAVMIVLITAAKYIAALLTQKTFKLSSDQRTVIFGLSSAHVAATLAAVMVGYNVIVGQTPDGEPIRLLGESVLNGTILMILATCTISTFATQRGAHNIAKPTRDQKEIAQVGTISANSDATIGNIIAEAMAKVGKEGVITVEEAKGLETTLDVVEGMKFDRGYLSPYFVTNAEKMVCELDNPYILCNEKKISSMKDMLPVLEQVAKVNRPLVIIAEDIEGEALATLVVNKLRGALNVVAVKAPGFGDRRKEMLQDIAVLTGGQVISEELGLTLKDATVDMLGRARQVKVTKENTIIVDGMGDKQAIADRVAQIRNQIGLTTSEYDKEKLQERLAKMAGGVAVIKVGAATETEMKEKKLRIEDALNATRAAVEEGVVAGGGTIFVNVIPAVEALLSSVEGDEKTGVRIVAKALEAPIRQIAANAGLDGSVILEKVRTSGKTGYGFDAYKEEYCDMIASGIVDPAKVTRSALENAASVSGMVLTTESLVADKPQPPAPAAPAPEMGGMGGMY